MEKVVLYISSGEHNCMFTLRTMHQAWTRGEGGKPIPYWKDSYSCNLANDWERAWDKYQSIINRRKEGGENIQAATKFEDSFDLCEWGSGGTSNWTVAKYMTWKIEFEDGRMPFGKHRYEAIADVPSGYRNWLRGEAEAKVRTGSKFEARTWQLVVDALAPFAEGDKAEASKIEAEKAAKRKTIEDAKANSRHVGEIGKRTTAKLTCKRAFAYEGAYGTGYVRIYRDDAGNAYKSFGKSPLGEGDTGTVKFTVKAHEEYKGEKQTLINRISEMESH